MRCVSGVRVWGEGWRETQASWKFELTGWINRKMNVPYVMVSRYKILRYVFIFFEDAFKPLIVRFISEIIALC